MPKLLVLAVIASALVTLTGCAERWEKPGATEYEFNAMKAACSSRAAARFPPMMRQVQLTNGYTTPITTNCSGYGYSVTCNTTGGQYVPPVIISVDDNNGVRSQDTRSCFFENGWRPEKDHPQEAAASEGAPSSGERQTSAGVVDAGCVKQCHEMGGAGPYSCEAFCGVPK